jgi:hypothetical protein
MEFCQWKDTCCHFSTRLTWKIIKIGVICYFESENSNMTSIFIFDDVIMNYWWHMNHFGSPTLSKGSYIIAHFSVSVCLSKISVTVPTIFLKLWENEEETILRIVTEPFFRKKTFPGLQGSKRGIFWFSCRWTFITRKPFRELFSYQVYMCGAMSNSYCIRRLGSKKLYWGSRGQNRK